MKRIIGAVCLLVLFVAYQTSITAFTHVHYVNGVIITHSHPFHGKHTHSKSELLVIGRLSTFQAPEVDVYEDLHPMRILLAVLEAEQVSPLIKGGGKTDYFSSCSAGARGVNDNLSAYSQNLLMHQVLF